jgi:hypothetical protein
MIMQRELEGCQARKFLVTRAVNENFVNTYGTTEKFLEHRNHILYA